MPLYLYETPTLVPVFTNQKKTKEGFCFYEKGQKVKIGFRACFAVSQYRHSTYPDQQEWQCRTPSPGSYIQHQDNTALKCAYEHLCFILTYFMHLLARYVLRY